MEQLVYALLIFSLFGSTCSVSNRAFRDLNRKVDLIRTTLAQEISNLKFEVVDLRSQLESEKTRADRLEELLNGTEAFPEADTSTLEDVDRDEDKDLTTQASVDMFAIMNTAFQREKEKARQLERTVTRKITTVSRTITSKVDNLTRVVKTVADDGQKTTRDMQSELSRIHDEADVSSDAIADLQLAVDNVTDDAKKIALDIEDVQHELTRIHGEVDVSNDEIVDLQQDLQLVHAEAKKTTEHVEQMTEHVSKEQRQLLPNRVSFHAIISEGKKFFYRTNETIIFPRVNNEDGGGYQEDTGIFTAPIAGKYIFSATITSDRIDQGPIVASIKHNDKHLVALLAESYVKQQVQSSVTAVQYLHAGDKVRVAMVQPDNGTIWGGMLTSFMGCLIVPY